MEAGPRTIGIIVRASLFATLLLSLAACQTASPPQADRLERGLQGQQFPDEVAQGILAQPYSRGISLIGHEAVLGRASNVQMAWAGHCAYISSSASAVGGIGASSDSDAGVAVVDVRNPRAPRLVRLLRERGAYNASETMHAVDAPDRSVLAAGDYGGAADNSWLAIYDVSDCADPHLTAEYRWPENVHTLTISPNGHRIYGAHLDPFTGHGGIHVLDISDLQHPRYIGKFGATGPDGESFEFAPHEVTISPDERRIYAGVIGSRGGDLNQHITTPDGMPTAERLNNDAGGVYILDNTDIAEGRADPRMGLIGTAVHAGWHSPVRATIGGAPYLVSAGELGPCPGAWPRIISIADESQPRIVGEFRLAMNLPENCPPREGVETQTMGIVGRPGTAASHFNDVDSADDTRLGLFNFMYAGLRIVDLREPANPSEIAYFKPGDPCGGHVRYLERAGQIWLTCAASGFYVLELTADIRG